MPKDSQERGLIIDRGQQVSVPTFSFSTDEDLFAAEAAFDHILFASNDETAEVPMRPEVDEIPPIEKISGSYFGD